MSGFCCLTDRSRKTSLERALSILQREAGGAETPKDQPVSLPDPSQASTMPRMPFLDLGNHKVGDRHDARDRMGDDPIMPSFSPANPQQFPTEFGIASTSSNAHSSIHHMELAPYDKEHEWRDHRESDIDGGLSNPVRLLAEAAEETSKSSLYHGTDPAETSTLLPPHYTMVSTLRSLLEEGQIDERVKDLSMDLEYLAEGLESMTSESALQTLTSGDKAFFKPPVRPVKRDLGAEYDPIDLGLLTRREADAFFAHYFLRLHPLLPVLDPILHTPRL